LKGKLIHFVASLQFLPALSHWLFNRNQKLIEGSDGKTALDENFNFEEDVPKVYHRSVHRLFH